PRPRPIPDHADDGHGGARRDTMTATPPEVGPVRGEREVRALGVHSEVGVLRTVMVCRPGLAHQRLTPGNRADLLFDDVLWVHEAQKDHYDFVLKMQERGVEVLDLHDLLAKTLENKEARDFVLDRRVTANSVGPGTAEAIRPWLDEMPAKELAAHLIGGFAIADLPDAQIKSILMEA